MEIKNFEIFGLFNSQEREKSFYRKLIGVKWAGGISYEIAKMGKILNNQFTVIDEARVNLVESMKLDGKDPGAFGQLTPDATEEAISKAKKDFDEFAKGFEEILQKAEDIKIEKIKIPSAKIPDIEPEVLLAFDKFIEVT